MIIPDYWDEHKEKRKLSSRKQATITRFGWSDLNQDDAKRHAKQRVEEAFQKLEDGQLNFVAVPGHWGTLPLSMKGALNGTTSKNIYRRFQGRRR